MPAEMMKPIDSSSKRPKLVLPAPQISDAELEQVVKLGRASEVAKEVVEENELLADYSVTSNAAMHSIRTPKSAVLSRDNILMEAQNLIALQNVDTPLKGGINTPLHEVAGFGSSVMTPGSARAVVAATPNALISTPFRTPSQQDAGPAGVKTPGPDVALLSASSTPSSTPGSSVRDKLTINPESALSFESEASAKAFRQDMKHELKKALSGLPAPKNDYEIVANDEEETVNEDCTTIAAEDQADIDARREAEEMERIEAEFRRQSQSVQRNLPRPGEINHTILKGGDGEVLTELQEAEEMIKEEMLVMLHHDALTNPTDEQAIRSSGEHSSFLSVHRFDEVSEEDMNEADGLLREEMQHVRDKMDHGEIPIQTYNAVWEECLSQVLHIPSQGKIVRANVASKKDRIDNLERRLELNRSHMTKEAKKAAKIEKKLKILLTGYQNRSAVLVKTLSETCDQLEQAKLDLQTFKRLRSHEESCHHSPSAG